MVKRMQAWLVERHGEPAAVLSLVEMPAPEGVHPRVRVHAAALNFADGLALRGRYQVKPPLPFVPGFELAGELLDDVPSRDLTRGDLVCAQVPWGAFAEEVAVPAPRLVAKPATLTVEQSAAFVVSWTTAQLALTDFGRLAAGETVFVHAAGGALGLAVVALAKARGARVLAGARSAEKRAAARAAGADLVIDTADPAWPEAVRAITPGVDVIVDSVGGDATLASARLLSWRGRLLLTGFASGAPAAVPANQLLVRAASAMGVFWSYDRDAPRIQQAHDELRDLFEGSGLSMRPPQIYPFDALPEALADLEAGRIIGKAVLSRA